MHAATTPIARHAAHGVIAAMAMTGLRRVTQGLGFVPEPPPEEIAREVPSLLALVPSDHRDPAIELGHWAYGAAGGVAFGLLPERVRRAPLAGPAWGAVTWALFERAVAPLLGLRRAEERSPVERLAILADHLLYGLVVAGGVRSRRE